MKGLIKKLLREQIDKPKLKYRIEHLDSYSGQHNMELGLYLGNDIVGLVQYVLYNGEMTVSDILVRPEFRRRGFGSRMMQYIKQQHPDYTYRPSMKTDLGTKFKHKEIKGDLTNIDEDFITEKSINDVSSSEFNIKGIAEDWLMSTPSIVVHNYKYEMQDDYTLSSEEREELMDADEDDIMETEEFKNWLIYEVEAKIDETMFDLKRKIKNGQIKIWRVMTVDNDWLNRLPLGGNRLGVFWSFEEWAAEAHWGGKESNTIKIGSIVDEKYVDWKETLMANIHPSTGEAEKEITLFKNTPLRILSLEVNNENIDINNIKEKTYKS